MLTPVLLKIFTEQVPSWDILLEACLQFCCLMCLGHGFTRLLFNIPYILWRIALCQYDFATPAYENSFQRHLSLHASCWTFWYVLLEPLNGTWMCLTWLVCLFVCFIFCPMWTKCTLMPWVIGVYILPWWPSGKAPAWRVGDMRIHPSLLWLGHASDLRHWYFGDYPARRLVWLGQCLDWLTWCQYTGTGWDSTFDLQLLSQCGSMCNCVSRSVPEIHLHVARMLC